MRLELLNKKGFGILEIVIATAIIGTSLFAMVSVFMLSRNTMEYSIQKLKASYLAEEGIEVLRFKRDSSWSGNIFSLSAGTDYYLAFSTTTSNWAITSTPQPPIDDLYARSFRIENVSRDSLANIQNPYNSANDDPGTKKIIMSVIWNYKNSNKNISSETYMTNLFGN